MFCSLAMTVEIFKCMPLFMCEITNNFLYHSACILLMLIPQNLKFFAHKSKFIDYCLYIHVFLHTQHPLATPRRQTDPECPMNQKGVNYLLAGLEGL